MTRSVSPSHAAFSDHPDIAYFPESLPDCDGNGIADSIDIAAGMADDVNHNGINDVCDPDGAIVRLTIQRYREDWKRIACQPDTVLLLVRHVATGQVIIEHTVPRGGGDVSLRILDPGKHVVRTLFTGRQPCGSYFYRWDKRTDSGLPAPPDVIYDVELRVNDRTRSAPTRWARSG